MILIDLDLNNMASFNEKTVRFTPQTGLRITPLIDDQFGNLRKKIEAFVYWTNSSRNVKSPFYICHFDVIPVVPVVPLYLISDWLGHLK